MATQDLSLLWESDDLLVKCQAGSGFHLSVSFSGIGYNEGDEQKPEFLATASAGHVNHVLTIIDRKRSWYSTQGVQDRIVAIVRQYIADHAITQVDCIGNSMGGFGALAFAARLGAAFAIALAPQFSMDPAVIADRRWERFRPFMRPSTMPRLADEMTDDVRYYLFFGDQAPKDLQHCKMFADEGRAKITLLRDTDHHVGNKLRDLQLLQPIKTAIANKNHARLAALLAPYVTASPQFD